MDMSRTSVNNIQETGQFTVSVCSNNAQDNDKVLPFVVSGITIFLLQQWFQVMYHSRGLCPIQGISCYSLGNTFFSHFLGKAISWESYALSGLIRLRICMESLCGESSLHISQLLTPVWQAGKVHVHWFWHVLHRGGRNKYAEMPQTYLIFFFFKDREGI